MRYQIVSGQSLSKMAGCRSSGHSSRSAWSVPPPFSGSASWTRTSGLSFSSDERTSRRQFCGAGEAGVLGASVRAEAGWEGEASLGAEVALREEEEDDLRALDVLLQRPDVF